MFLLFSPPFVLGAQQVTGTVRDAAGQPIAGAEIKNTFSDSIAFSNFSGYFRVSGDFRDMLQVSTAVAGTVTVRVIDLQSDPHAEVRMPNRCDYEKRSSLCPKCHSSADVIPYSYGKPGTESIKKEKAGLLINGGCIFYPCAPKYFCKRDSLSF
jgi:hypothetical protein